MKVKLFRKYSLKHRILLLTILVSSILSTIFTFISLSVDYKLGVKKMDQRIRNIEITTLGSLKGALWDLNMKIIQVQLTDLAEVEGITWVQLIDESSATLFEKKSVRNAGKGLSFSSFKKTYPLYFEIDGQRIYGGKLLINYSREHIYKEVIRRALIVFISQAAKTFFVSFLLVLLYEKLITNDLVNISSVLKGLKLSSTKESTLFPKKREGEDEITILQHQIEEMYQRISQINKENADLLTAANNEKRQQEAKAQNAARLASLGEMAAGIAHEINNPLTIVKGNVHAITKKIRSGVDINDESILKTFGKVDTAVERITKIIRNMKKISRDGSQEALSDIVLKDLIFDTLEYYEEKFRKADISFNVSFGNPVTVSVREVELCQVLVNIMNNANDAICDNPNKWINVDIDENESHVFIRITDSGSGIGQDATQKIFNPFYTTKDVGKGTGLGLSISKDAMGQMGGDLLINEDCENTQFVLTLKKSGNIS